MTTRSTTLVESDQLAQAAVTVIRNEDLVPKGGKRWPFARVSKAQRDYEKAVQEITDRRREAREQAVEQKLKKARSEADATLERAKGEARAARDEKVAEAKKPYDEIETQARAERDAAIAAANRAYEQALSAANRIYQEEKDVIERKHDALVSEARSVHDAAYARLDESRQADVAQIAKDMKTIPLEGPMRVVEDKQTWSLEDRRRALIGIVDMAGREDFDVEYTDLCLRTVTGYVFNDRFLKPEAQHQRLMDAVLLEAFVELARRVPEKRPTIVKYMHDLVVQNPGHSSPTFIKSLTELYVIASADVETLYDKDVNANEQVFETMRAHIADTLKVTPRRSQVPAAPQPGREPSLVGVGVGVGLGGEERKPPLAAASREDDITSDVDVGDLVPIESHDVHDVHDAPDAHESAPTAADSPDSPDAPEGAEPDPAQAGSQTTAPPRLPPARRRRRVPVSEDSNA
ncbi:MAG: hypothetical protein ABW321_10875 [Polyangiales bacterium]